MVSTECIVRNFVVEDIDEKRFDFVPKPGTILIRGGAEAPVQIKSGGIEYLDDFSDWIIRCRLSGIKSDGSVAKNRLSTLRAFSFGAAIAFVVWRVAKLIWLVVLNMSLPKEIHRWAAKFHE